MYLIGIILIAVFIVIDTTIGFYVGSVLVGFNLCSLFLCHATLRRPFRYMVAMVFIYSMVARVFSGYGFTELFFSYMIVLSVFYKIRTEIYTESYLVQAFWVMLVLALKAVVLFLFDWSAWHVGGLMFEMGQILINMLFCGVLVLPVFYFLDSLFNFVGASILGRNHDGMGTVF